MTIWILLVVHAVLTFATLLVSIGAAVQIRSGKPPDVFMVNAFAMAVIEWWTTWTLWQVARGAW